MAAAGSNRGDMTDSNVIVRLLSSAGSLAKHLVTAHHKASGVKQEALTDDKGVAAFKLQRGEEYLIQPAEHGDYQTHPGQTISVPASGQTQASIEMLAKSSTPAAPQPPQPPSKMGVVASGSSSSGTGYGGLVIRGKLTIASEPATQLAGSTVTVALVGGSVPAGQAEVEHDGTFDVTLKGVADWYTVEVDLKPGLIGYAADYTTPFMVYVPVDGVSVILPYQSQAAPLVLSAEDAYGLPIPNSTFRIYSGLSTIHGSLMNSIQATRGALPVTNLTPGQYTIVCAPPKGNGFVPIASGGDQFSIWLDGGSSQLSYVFRFQSLNASVTGTVLNQEKNQPVAGIEMQLIPVNGTVASLSPETTDLDGIFTFENVPAGVYQLGLVSDENLVNGVTLIAAGLSPAPITVPSSGNVAAGRFLLMEDIHRISGHVLDDKGNPLPGVDVHIESLTGSSKTKVTSDVSGYYEWVAPLPGQYRMKLSQEQWDVVTVGQPVTKDLVRAGATTQSPGGNKANESIIDLSAYPILTEQVGTTGGTITPSGGTGGGAGGSSLAQTISQNLRQVLGWKARNDDPKGFVGALTQSFNLANDEGHVVATWVPRTYAVQTDFNGGITGAQASLLTRTQEAVDRSQPLLDGLYPLRPDSDAEYITAIKAVIKNQYISLVNELGTLGGPRLARVNQIFQLLLGPLDNSGNVITDPDAVTGEFGNLRKQLGLRMASVRGEKGGFAINVTDEQDQTNYRVMVDYLSSLRASWNVNSQFFLVGGSQPFLGTQLVLISRALSVVAETVDEVRSTLDSVFIGPSERQTLQLNLIDDSGLSVPMYVEDLLTWIQTFATQEGPELVQDGGKFALGIEGAFGQISKKLAALAESAQHQKGTSLPAGYKTPRVKRALAELARRLAELNTLGSPFTAPFGLASTSVI